jgi:hypothetical protein
MAGVGRFSSLTRPTSRSRLITRRTAWAATFLQKRTIGFTSGAIPFSIQSKKGKTSTSTARRGVVLLGGYQLQKKQYLAATMVI